MSRSTFAVTAGACALVISVVLLARDVTAGPGSGAAQLRAPMGTGFTYQGYLESSGTPVTGNCAMVFKLFSDQAASAQVGGDDVQLSVDVVDGLFSATLNAAGQFGAGAFDGSERWLQPSMNCPGSGGAVVLPVQAIRPAPYAIFASEAASAAQAGNAANLGGFPASHYTRYLRTILVSPGATPADSGANLVAALAGITDASASKTYLVKIEPGIYELGATQLVAKEFVDIEGSGRLMTTISGGRTGSLVSLPVNSELRDLRVQNLGPTGSTGVSVEGPAMGTAKIRDAHIYAAGTAASAVAHTGANARLEVFFSTLEAVTAGGSSSAVLATGGPTLIADGEVVFSESAPGASVRGVHATGTIHIVRSSVRVNSAAATLVRGLEDSSGFVLLDSSQIEVNVTSASPSVVGIYVLGLVTQSRVIVTGSGSVIGAAFGGVNPLRYTVVTATAGSGISTGLSTVGPATTIKDSEIRALGAAPTKRGIANGGDGTPDAITIDRTTVEGATNAFATTGGSDPVFIGASQLIGGDVSKGAATYKCVNVYGENYMLLNTDCTGTG